MTVQQKENLGFSGHESFPFRYTWLTKGVFQVSQDPQFFSRNDAMVKMGVGKNMVNSIRYWCLATRMIEEVKSCPNRTKEYRPSELGKKIFLDNGWDPYLEKIGTLWLIHWLLVTNKEKATTWYILFNECNYSEFSKDALYNLILAFYEKHSTIKLSQNTLKRDVDVCIRTYVSKREKGLLLEESLDCPLSELGLIIEDPVFKTYAFVRGEKETLPNEIFVYALWEYRQRRPNLKTLSFSQVCYDVYSPGKVFKLDEPSVARRLDSIEKFTEGKWHFSETAGLKELIISEEIDPIEILKAYYENICL